ncbi:MAG: EF2563 family selenium-dependent molybdenum hydroxylase system protein [Candidatus Marinimicrobia bacterium]|nr:EF2563 family selenium-dependent molybdenum hydroxylase system protein [Candidatus Neomarinimicrobiota bacterium]
MFDQLLIWVRGAGEMASAAAHSLHNAGFKVVLSELARPLAIRRQVAFCEAMYHGTASVEGVTAKRCEVEAVADILAQDMIPVVKDEPDKIRTLKPDVLVDARMLKRPPEEFGFAVDLTIGLGPGFVASDNCTAVIETNRGHALGRIIRDGGTQPDTKIPGDIGGQTRRRVVYAPVAGKVRWKVEIGDLVAAHDELGTMAGAGPIEAPLSGLVRGLISPEVQLTKGMKIGDIDPRGAPVDPAAISDKARAVGRGVLEAVLTFYRGSSR